MSKRNSKKSHLTVTPKRVNTSVQPNYGNARVLASIFDWVVGGIVSGLPGVVVYAIFSGSSKPMTSLYVFEDAGIGRNITLMTSLLCLAFGFLYYVVIPWRVYPGQTIGKKITHIKIVRRDGKPLNLGMLILRQFVFLVFIEGLATATSTYVKVFLTITTKFYVDGYLTIIWFALTVMSMFLLFWNHQHLALHDRVLGTTVILLTGNK